VFERYDIVSEAELRVAAEKLAGVTGTPLGTDAGGRVRRIGGDGA